MFIIVDLLPLYINSTNLYMDQINTVIFTHEHRDMSKEEWLILDNPAGHLELTRRRERHE
jgi:hypothetical protein